jgi:hypothetical protein
MTIRPPTVQSDPKPCAWRALISIFGGQAVSGHPPGKRRHAKSPRPAAWLPLLRRDGTWVIHKGPIGGFLMTRLGPCG